MKNLKYFVIGSRADCEASDESLSKKGIRSAQNAAEYIAKFAGTKTLVIGSEFTGARLTAEVISSRLNAPIEIVAELAPFNNPNIPQVTGKAYSYIEGRQEAVEAEILVCITQRKLAKYLLFMALEKLFPNSTLSKIFIKAFEDFKPGQIVVVDLIEKKITVPSF